ncbi:glycosyl hydrolase family 95 catalytic domain-containing protein [Isoptericola jiangsuensis]|uniref:glycosyl hydrolase family 95 catalytic domain-containing protein n=1 Tax=Isoptericola jiangsuensis TaxID=548579 RepID=UPI003AAC773D
MRLVADSAEGATELRLWYDEPAPDTDDGWADRSLAMGNGYMGVNLFGGTETERLQITENSLYDSIEGGGQRPGGLNSFAEVYLDFGHEGTSDYERELVLDEGVSRVQYTHDGVDFSREYFTSYPDKVLAMRLSASEAGELSFTLRPTIPFLREYRNEPGDNRGKSGTVVAADDTITMSGVMEYYGVEFEGQFKVIPDGGTLEANNDGAGDNGTISVTDADSAIVLFAAGTNYESDPQVVLEEDRLDKLEGFPHPHDKVTEYLAEAASKSYEELLAAHQDDYTELYDRMSLDLGSEQPAMPTDDLVDAYREGTPSTYLEELAFQFGRYMLISSSRAGTLPPTLQGIWNVYENPPWGSRYLHDLNLEMAYSPAFPTNMPELFESYTGFFEAFEPRQQEYATEYIDQYNPDQLDPGGDNGWSGPFWAAPYDVPGKSAVAGFGTGGWISLMFWDYYDYTQDEQILEDIVYPTLYGQANFMSRFVQEHDGYLLANPSSSPEQLPRNTIGTTFDQQMIYETHLNTLKAAEILGRSDSRLSTLDDQLPLLDPIQVGASGQIKEFREEEYYGEFGDPEHRHISHLLGMSPGQLISSDTPAWLDAAEVSLEGRGADSGIGWAQAKRISLWAKVQDGNEAYSYYQDLLQNHFMHNLFNNHRLSGVLFQADGNYGATAGVADMLLQSHDDVVSPLPALPDEWSEGRFEGMLARGNFEVSAEWSAGHADQFDVLAKSGGTLTLDYPNIADAVVQTADGHPVEVVADGDDLIQVETVSGQTLTVTDIPPASHVTAPAGLTVVDDQRDEVELSWTSSPEAESYTLYRAVGSAPDYETVATDITQTAFTYAAADLDEIDQMTLRVVAVSPDGRQSDGATTVRLLPEEEAVDDRPIFTGTASQSSTRFGGVPELALDGDTSEDTHSHTDFEDQPWWQVDLGEVRQIDEIKIWNRTKPVPAQRTKEFYVLVSDEPFVSGSLDDVLDQPGVDATYYEEVPDPTASFDIDRDARYVRVQLTGVNEGTSVALHLAEVQIFGSTDDEAPQDVVRPVVELVSPGSVGPFAELSVQVDATDDVGLERIVANVYQDGELVRSTQSAVADGATSGSHTAQVSLPDGDYVVRFNAHDLAGNVSRTGSREFSVDGTAPRVTVKSGDRFTVGAGPYEMVSFKLFDAGLVDRVEVNGAVKDLSDDRWSDVNFLTPGTFGAVQGENVLRVFDVAGNSSTVEFTLD